MNYDYFLNEYGRIDSTYYQQMSTEEGRRSLKEVPPASIFIFVEKPPYGEIQRGILYDTPNEMKEINNWMATYRSLPGRKSEIYYEGEKTKVYRIITRRSQSKVSDILMHIYPNNRND